MDLMQSYQRDSQQILGQHPQAFPEYQSAFHNATPYSSPQAQQYGHFGEQYGHQQSTYNTPYTQRPDQTSQSSVAHGQLPRPQFGSNPGGEPEGDNRSGGAAITTSY